MFTNSKHNQTDTERQRKDVWLQDAALCAEQTTEFYRWNTPQVLSNPNPISIGIDKIVVVQNCTDHLILYCDCRFPVKPLRDYFTVLNFIVYYRDFALHRFYLTNL